MKRSPHCTLVKRVARVRLSLVLPLAIGFLCLLSAVKASRAAAGCEAAVARTGSAAPERPDQPPPGERQPPAGAPRQFSPCVPCLPAAAASPIPCEPPHSPARGCATSPLPARQLEAASPGPPWPGRDPPDRRPGLSVFLQPRPPRGPPAAS